MARILWTSGVIGAMLCASMGGSPASADFQLPGEEGVQARTLDNGLLVLVRERPTTEVAAISVGIRGGSRDEEPATVGAAHFMEHMYFQGTPRRPTSQEIDQEVTARGGWLNAWTGWESINFQAMVPADEFDVALGVISDLLVNSLFEEEKIDKERRVVLEELNRRLNSPGGHVQDVFARTIFEGHPAENLPIGNRETLARSDRAVLVNFRDTYFVANNMVVAVVGNVRAEEVFAKVGQAFAEMRTGPKPSFHPAAPPLAREWSVDGAAPGQQARLALGTPAPGSDNDDRYALDLLTSVLGASGRRLHNEVVEARGLASDIGVAFWELTDVGVWEVWASTTPDRVSSVIEVVKAQVQDLRARPLDQAAIDEAKAYIRGSSRLGLESSISQAQRYSDGVVLGRFEALDHYLERIQALTAEDVLAVANKYLDPDRMTLVVLKPSVPEASAE
jgi:predicted Zn-dependent peptidase